MTLTVGGVFGEAWKLYERLFGRSVVVAGIVFAVISVFEFATALTDDPYTFGLLALLAVALAFIGDLLVQGALAEAVRDLHDGREPAPVRDLFRRTRPRMPTLALGAIIYAAGCFGGLLLLIVPGLIVLARWSLIVPVIVLEGQSAREARRRSSALVKGRTVRVLAIVFLALFATSLFAAMISGIFLLVPSPVASPLGGLVGSALTTPFIAHVLTVLYYRLVEPDRPVIAEQPKRWRTIWQEEKAALPS